MIYEAPKYENPDKGNGKYEGAGILNSLYNSRTGKVIKTVVLVAGLAGIVTACHGGEHKPTLEIDRGGSNGNGGEGGGNGGGNGPGDDGPSDEGSGR